MRKHRRPPEILWMLFGNRVRTLAETITSLLPPHPSSSVPKDCRFCKGRRCLSCRGGANGMSFLLRRNDPAAYRNLLSRSFAVVSENAPEVTRFSPDSNWSQIEIVRAVIEFMMVEQPSSTNVIWSCYDKCNQSSPNLELLNTKAWRLLLERVGDGIMVYLLRNASIFLTMPLQKHQQVTGPPISDLCGKKSKGVKRSYNQQSSISPCGRGKKRKREDNVHSMLKRQKLCSSFITSKTSSSSTCNGCYSDSGLDGNKHSHNPTSSVTNDHDGNLNQEHQESSERLRKRSRPFSWQRRRNRRLLSSQETSNQDCCRVLTTEQFSGSLSTDKTNSFAVCNDNGFDSSKHIHTPTSTLIEGCDGDLNQNPQQGPEGLKKRSRPFSWQRRRKRMLLPPKETSIQDPLPTILCDKESLPGRLLCCLEQNCDHKCSCFGFRIPRKVAKEAQIDRKFMFFNLEHSSSAFPRNHVLNSLRPNSASSEFLVKSIFGISEKESARSKKCPYGSSLCIRGSASLYHSLAELLKILIRRAQRFHTGKLLEKHCGVSGPSLNCKKKCAGILEGDNWQNSVLKKCQRHITDHCNSSREAADGSSEPIESYCSKSQVVSFIWAVCRSIIPADFLGSTSNWRILRRNIYKFVCLRRFEKFSLKQCMHKLKTSKFPFLSNNQYFCSMNSEALKGLEGKGSNMHKGLAKLNDAAHIVKQRVLESWIYWFFASIVVPVLQANFYITESEYGKQDVYYYQKSVWEKVKNKAITCMKDQRYHYLNDATTRRIIRRRSFGFSKLRICPKGCGMRLLANLRASSRMPRKEFNLEGQSTGRRRTKKDQTKVKFEHFKSVNGVLRDTHAVIKDIRLKEPDKLGSSVFDYNDVYRKFCPFVIGLKNGSTIMPDVFIVVSDVSKAFDTVDQDKLLSVMNDIIRTDEYFVKHSFEVLCTKGSLWVHENPALVDQNTSLRFRSSARYRSLHTVLVNQECSRSLKREELFFNLNQHIKRNVLQLDRKFYLQGVGIPQGSILSSLLCSLYYGHLDRNVIFPFLERTLEAGKEELSRGHSYEGASAGQSGNEDEIPSSASYILQRFIDDFLFISTSRNQAASFFSRLQRGFRDYNCYMNEKKFCVNFEIPHIPGMSSSRVYLGEDGILFLRWSGLLINSCTLEVQADYTKYLNNHLSSTLTVSWEGPPRRHLKAKLCAYMRPKCHPIFFDSNINSASVVRLNIYQAFLICAMKFHCYVRDVSYVWKLCSRSCANIVKSSLRYMKTLIKRRFRSAYNRFDFQPILQLKKGEIEWLGLFAYVQVLKRKQSRHKELISLLTSKLSSHRITRSVSSQLSYAVDRSHSSLIWKIKY